MSGSLLLLTPSPSRSRNVLPSNVLELPLDEAVDIGQEVRARCRYAETSATHARFQIEAALRFERGIRHFEPAAGASENRQVVDVGCAKALADAADDLEGRRQTEQRAGGAGQRALLGIDEQRARYSDRLTIACGWKELYLVPRFTCSRGDTSISS